MEYSQQCVSVIVVITGPILSAVSQRTALHLPYGTPEGTFPFQYLAEKTLDSMLFKRDLDVIISRLNDILFYFPFLG